MSHLPERELISCSALLRLVLSQGWDSPQTLCDNWTTNIEYCVHMWSKDEWDENEFISYSQAYCKSFSWKLSVHCGMKLKVILPTFIWPLVEEIFMSRCLKIWPQWSSKETLKLFTFHHHLDIYINVVNIIGKSLSSYQYSILYYLRNDWFNWYLHRMRLISYCHWNRLSWHWRFVVTFLRSYWSYSVKQRYWNEQCIEIQIFEDIILLNLILYLKEYLVLHKIFRSWKVKYWFFDYHES